MDTTSGVFVEISYLKTDMCKCESTHRHESRTQLADSLKACSKPTAPVAHPRTVTRKSSIGIFSFVQGSLTLQILTKTPLISSLSCFHLGEGLGILFEGLNPPMLPVAMGLPHPLYIGILFPLCFLLLLFCLLIVFDFDSMHFFTFLLLHVKYLQLKIDLWKQQRWLNS